MPRRFLFIFDDVSADGFVGPDGFLQFPWQSLPAPAAAGKPRSLNLNQY